MNIKIGDIYIDNSDKTESIITNLTSNSVEIFTKRKSSKGVDCKSWISIRDLDFLFTKKSDEKKYSTNEDEIKQKIKSIIK